MIATSNFVNIIPAMISAALFQVIVVLAYATGFSPEVQVQDGVARQTGGSIIDAWPTYLSQNCRR